MRKEIPTVEQIMTANFWKVLSIPPKSARPAPKVVTVPEKILTPISVYAYFILLDLFLWLECM